MGQGKQEVYFSEHCMQEGVSISRVLQALIGGVDTSSHLIAESDSETLSTEQNQPQHTDSQAALGCASKLIGILCMHFVDPPHKFLVCNFSIDQSSALHTWHIWETAVNAFLAQLV